MLKINHTKICQKERELLQSWKEKGLSNKECARRLGRHPSSIGRELKRNSVRGVYLAASAQLRADKRKERAWGVKHPLKNKKVFRYVISRLMRGWSPEQIAGRLTDVLHPDDESWHISHECIYAFIYHPSQKHRAWWEYLRRKHKRRRKKRRKTHRERIPDRVSIHKRPKEVEDREEVGHWEGDTVVGKAKTNGVHTEYERVSSYIRVEHMSDLTAESSARAQVKIFRGLPEMVRRTTTLDNGPEHVLHKRVEKETGVKSYFADPYSAYQRGGNENANLWIRYYFPKGTDFSKISEEELADVEWELNNRPRKRLGFYTPYEVLSKLLQQGLQS